MATPKKKTHKAKAHRLRISEMSPKARAKERARLKKVHERQRQARIASPAIVDPPGCGGIYKEDEPVKLEANDAARARKAK
jgi:hypothetical protein